MIADCGLTGTFVIINLQSAIRNVPATPTYSLEEQVATLDSIFNAVLEGNAPAAQAGVKVALAEGVAPDTILKDGLIAAMGEVGRLFEETNTSCLKCWCRALCSRAWRCSSRSLAAQIGLRWPGHRHRQGRPA